MTPVTDDRYNALYRAWTAASQDMRYPYDVRQTYRECASLILDATRRPPATTLRHRKEGQHGTA